MKVKVLMILPTLNYCGGIERFVMNYYNNMSNDVVIDVITYENKSNEYKEYFQKRGGNVYVFEAISFKNIFNSIKTIKNFFKKNNDYDIIHCNMANASPFYFYYAKKYDIKTRILHSHQSNYADKISHKIRNMPLIFLGKQLATDNVACSKVAGDFLFKNKKYVIFNNAINIKKFLFNNKIRCKIRSQYKIDKDTLVIGNIGRLTEQKNHKFLLEIFKEIKKINPKYKLLIIGDGELHEEILQKIKQEKLTDDVLLIPSVSNTEDYFQAMDIFVLPSLYEGLPFVAVEAQANGLMVLTSDTVSKEIPVNQLKQYYSLKKTAKDWANEIICLTANISISSRKDFFNQIKDAGFDIKTQAQKLEKYYKEKVRENG